jgi:hypothetical protein
VGDWNFVERLQDKSRNNRQTMTIKERGLFESLTSSLGIKESFPDSSCICFSWDNKRVADLRMMARLD